MRDSPLHDPVVALITCLCGARDRAAHDHQGHELTAATRLRGPAPGTATQRTAGTP